MADRIVPEDILKELLTARETLACLQCSGVDNWDWYEDALEPMDNWEENQLPTVLSYFQPLQSVQTERAGSEASPAQNGIEGDQLELSLEQPQGE